MGAYWKLTILLLNFNAPPYRHLKSLSHMSTGIVFHSDYLKHEAGDFHPESPDRLRSVISFIEESRRLDSLVKIEPERANRKWIEYVHPPHYVDIIQEAAGRAPVALDLDTHVCAASYDVALLAAGGLCRACDAVIAGQATNAFCASRPPGHHAEREHAMGFCLFNHIAVAARYLQRNHGLNRVLIIDWDVHHGNGTQNLFENDPRVFYFSIHQWPHYPGTGSADQTGRGEGKGATLNVPMAAGAGDVEYIAAFTDKLVPAAHRFQPDFVLVSAGFDAHRDDPLASIVVTEDGFAEMTRIVRQLARELCHDRLVSLLEGGYDLDALARSVDRHLEEMESDIGNG